MDDRGAIPRGTPKRLLSKGTRLLSSRSKRQEREANDKHVWERAALNEHGVAASE